MIYIFVQYNLSGNFNITLWPQLWCQSLAASIGNRVRNGYENIREGKGWKFKLWARGLGLKICGKSDLVCLLCFLFCITFELYTLRKMLFILLYYFNISAFRLSHFKFPSFRARTANLATPSRTNMIEQFIVDIISSTRT